MTSLSSSTVPISGAVPSLTSTANPHNSSATNTVVMADVLFAGVLLKAGDDNSRWKKRYFQLIALPNLGGLTATNVRVRLQYFENDKDAQKGKPCRGELSIADIGGIAVFGSKTAPIVGSGADPAVQACIRLTWEHHIQEGPVRLMLWGRDRLWRLAETSMESNVVGELIRALDRVQMLPKIAVRAAGWMRTQGTLTWNRRYAMLLSSGDLMLFRDASLDQLRRRIELAKAIDIRPLQPLAPAGSQQEKRVVRILAFSMNGGTIGSWEMETSADVYELVGIRVRHPDIPEKRGYVMCVESTQSDDASLHYARFRKWIVQLQLSAAEARLSGFASRELGTSETTTAAENDELLERKLHQIVQSSSSPDSVISSREISIGIALPYLLRMGSFPALWKSSLWFVFSGGATLKKTIGISYSQLIQREQSCFAVERVAFALQKIDPELKELRPIVELFLRFGGEENVFWTFASLAAAIKPPSTIHLSTSSSTIPISSNVSSSAASLRDFFRSGFASHVESKVVLDLLGMAKPSLVAHLSAYDLSTALLERCAKFMTTCSLPQVWDAVCVLGGKEAFSFAAVSLLIQKESQLMECYSEEELVRVVDAALNNQEMRFRWDQVDVRVADQVRRAQWSAIVDTLRDHSKLVSSYSTTAAEIRALGSRMVEQLNRILNITNDDSSSSKALMESTERIHQAATEMNRVGKEVLVLAEAIHAQLDAEITRSGRMGMVESSWASSSLNHSRAQDSNVMASSLIPKIQDLHRRVAVFAWMCLHLAWNCWTEANRISYRLCLFIPRASINVSVSKSSPPSVPLPPAFRASSHDLLVTNSSTSGPASAPTQPQPQFLSSSYPSRPVLMNSLSPIAQSPTSEDPEAPNSFKSIAIGLGKRLFQQRFLPGSVQQQQQQQSSSLQDPGAPSFGTLSLPSSSNPHVQHVPDRVPVTPSLSPQGSPVQLLHKYRGGFVGLAEVAGLPVDAALVRDSQLKDSRLMYLLDVLDTTLRASSAAERLNRWMLARDQPPAVTDLSSELRRLFLSQVPVLDRDNFKALEESLFELYLRSTGTYPSY